MEHLTKQQIVLVTLLVSFVTSIATGIVTVSLLDQAPAAVTQTINRVVERTIERVVQVPSQQAAIITKETVIIKEGDQVVTAIEKVNPSLVRIITRGPEPKPVELKEGEEAKEVAQPEETLVALGIILTREGVIAADSRRVSGSQRLHVRLADGTVYPVDVLTSDSETQRADAITLLKVIIPEEENITFTAASMADSDAIKLGQTVVFVGGRESNTVATDLVSNIKYKESPTGSQATSTTKVVTAKKVIGISVGRELNSPLGGVLMNLSGDVFAFALARSSLHFVPSNTLSLILQVQMASALEIDQEDSTLSP